MATWMITGANRGIGLELCKVLLARGDSVIAGSRNPEGARDFWELSGDFKDRFRSVKLDVANPQSIEECAQQLRDTVIDVLVNNAGILNGEADGLATVKIEDVVKSFEINTFGPMRVTRAFLPMITKSKTPKIASITSRMGSITDNSSGGYYAYRMSKAALNMFHKSFATEFPKIASAVLHPGWVQTDMGGDKAPVTPHESAVGMVHVIDQLTTKSNAAFLDYKGQSIPW